MLLRFPAVIVPLSQELRVRKVSAGTRFSRTNLACTRFGSSSSKGNRQTKNTPRIWKETWTIKLKVHFSNKLSRIKAVLSGKSLLFKTFTFLPNLYFPYLFFPYKPSVLTNRHNQPNLRYSSWKRPADPISQAKGSPYSDNGVETTGLPAALLGGTNTTG